MNWWQRLTHRREMEQRLDQELSYHLDQRVAGLVAGGCDPGEARRLARLEFGGQDQIKEDCRDARGTRWLEDLARDFRYALRSLRHRPGFTAVALLTLALGTGATTVMFTVVNGVLLKPLPYPDPGRLLDISGHLDNSRWAFQYLAYPDFQDMQRRIRTVDLSGWLFNTGTLSEPGEAEFAQEFEISGNALAVLGVRPLGGRAFLPEEDRIGGTPVAILGYSMWQHHFGGDPKVIGTTLVLDGTRRTIVGIAPAGFALDGEGDVYTPLGQDPAAYLKNRSAHPVRGIARLRPGATLAQTRAEVALIGRNLEQQYPDSNKDRSFRANPMRPDVDDVRSTLWLLLGAVGLVLLIACANVAGLLLARAVSREREFAMRAALGAGRLRLVRQCLTESTVLAVAGGLLGVGLATLGIQPFLALWPGDLPRAAEVRFDFRVLAFALALSVASGLFFGIAPALRVRVRMIEQTLRGASRSVTDGSRRLHGAFVISEIALATVLLVSAGMLGRTLLHLSANDPGVNIQNVLVFRMALSPATLPHPPAIRAAWDEILEGGRRIPGVQSMASVDTVPLRQGRNENGYWTSAAVPPETQQPVALSTCVSPDYFKVMGIPLRQGRLFTDKDRLGTQRVIVIDQILAQNAFGSRSAVGRLLWIPDMGKEPLEVAGVVGHVRYWGLAGDDRNAVRAQFYYPFAQVPDGWLQRWSQLMSIAVRTTVPPLTLLKPLRHELRGVANDQVLYEVRTMEQLARASLDRQRFLLLLFGIFAGLALVLACIGIYGVEVYLTNRRVPEIGIRMALGATTRNVRWMVLRESLVMIGAGAVLGLAGAWAAGRVLLRLVEGMQPSGLSPLALAMAVLAAAGLAASFLPARRASRVDPMKALRQD